MHLSRYLLPTFREVPSEAKIASHRLMLRTSMIFQTSAGIYSWLPLGLRVLKKIEQIVREEQNKAGAHEILMPTIQPADLWRESGRYDDYGKEMLRIQDRHERDMLYGPTAEEVVTDIFRNLIFSYKDLPKLLYQIHWKFRDEIRPRFGVMRGREFFMKDTYSFDLSEETSRQSYLLMFKTYIKTFARMGLTALPVKAPTGPIGGDLSHEFQIVAATGESKIFYDAAIDSLPSPQTTEEVEKLTKIYAAADEMHDPNTCPVPKDQLKTARGIEVGHIFYFGTKYSEAMGANVTDHNGNSIPVHMGSYGIGISRLVGAIIEANHDDNGIIWPASVAPFHVGLLNLRIGDEACDSMCTKIYNQLQQHKIEVLYDDRAERAGVKFADMDLIGLPYQLIIGPKGAAANKVEVKDRRTGDRQELSLESALTYLNERLGN